MPIMIDDSLDPSLFPLAWLVGEWEGHGAVQLLDGDGSEVGRGVEQHLSVAPDTEGGLTWHMRTWVLDAPAPTPPTAAFYEGTDQSGADQADASHDPTDPSAPVRELLLEERGTWRVSGPLAGQDVEAASKAKPGSPESYLSHGLTLTMKRSTGFGEQDAEHWAGEVRGPRIQLATQSLPDPQAPRGTVHAARMFGLVGGRLMWLQEIGQSPSTLRPYLSVELDRASELMSREEVAEAESHTEGRDTSTEGQGDA